jgi:hypothetical protein
MKRIYHTWDKWECYPSGFYDDKPKAEMTKDEAEAAYASFLSDSIKFEAAGMRVLRQWPNSCEHYLSNENMNRIAWIGQSAACVELGIPSAYRGGFNRLSEAQQVEANTVALRVLNRWLVGRGEPELSMEQAQSKTEANLY